MVAYRENHVPGIFVDAHHINDIKLLNGHSSSSSPPGQRQPLELGYFREVKITDLHGWHDHVKRLLAAGTKRYAHGLDAREHVDEALAETEVAHTLPHAAVFHQESAVTGHAREHFFVGIDFADVPQPRDQHAAFGGGDHLRQSLRILRGRKNDVERHLAHFVGEKESVAGGRDGPYLVFMLGALHSFSRGSGIDDALDHSVLDQRHAQPAHALPVEGRPGLQGMGDVVPDGDVVAEELAADAAGEEGTLVEDGHA